MIDLPTFTRDGNTYLPLAAAQALPRNAKLHDEPGIRRSMALFGYIDTITVNRATGHLLGGHGRVDALAALQAEGEEPPAGVLLTEDGDWAVPVHLAEVPEALEEAAALALNRMVERGADDVELLADVLSDIKNRDADLLDATGYSRSEFADILDAVAESQLDTSRPLDEEAEIRPPDTVMQLGDFRFPVEREVYLDWHEAIRYEADSFGKDDVIDEINRRLGLDRFEAGVVEDEFEGVGESA